MSSPFDQIQEEDLRRVEEVIPSYSSHNGSLFSPDIILFVQKIVAEAIGTFFIVFAGCGSVILNKKDGTITFPGICITWGLIVMVMVYTLGHVSGGHFNPAVTTAFTLLKRFPYKDLPFYVFAQLIGSILASGVLFLLLNPKPTHYFGTVPAGTAMQSFCMEFIITFLLMFTVCSVGTDDRAIGELGGIAVGSTILLNVLVGGPISGASMNPARSIGPAIIMHNFKDIWVYIVGPVIGAVAGGFVYNFLRLTEEPPRETIKNDSFLNNSTSRDDIL
ncbi:putative major intrinsic protein [Dioscorea sansibarensis]